MLALLPKQKFHLLSFWQGSLLSNELTSVSLEIPPLRNTIAYYTTVMCKYMHFLKEFMSICADRVKLFIIII